VEYSESVFAGKSKESRAKVPARYITVVEHW
jgi:hypothetical protein